MDLKNQKIHLIERLGLSIEKEEKIAPLAARILSTVILTDKEGISFDQLVQDLNASKSTISTHLDNLQCSGRISYFTKPGDRKRYFTITAKRFIQIIDDIIETWENKKQINQDILKFKEEYNKAQNDDEKPYELSFHKDYLIFLDEAGAAIKKLKQNLSKKHFDN